MLKSCFLWAVWMVVFVIPSGCSWGDFFHSTFPLTIVTVGGIIIGSIVIPRLSANG
jgi:hypothetical protein